MRKNSMEYRDNLLIFIMSSTGDSNMGFTCQSKHGTCPDLVCEGRCFWFIGYESFPGSYRMSRHLQAAAVCSLLGGSLGVSDLIAVRMKSMSSQSSYWCQEKQSEALAPETTVPSPWLRKRARLAPVEWALLLVSTGLLVSALSSGLTSHSVLWTSMGKLGMTWAVPTAPTGLEASGCWEVSPPSWELCTSSQLLSRLGAPLPSPPHPIPFLS